MTLHEYEVCQSRWIIMEVHCEVHSQGVKITRLVRKTEVCDGCCSKEYVPANNSSFLLCVLYLWVAVFLCGQVDLHRPCIKVKYHNWHTWQATTPGKLQMTSTCMRGWDGRLHLEVWKVQSWKHKNRWNSKQDLPKSNDNKRNTS